MTRTDAAATYRALRARYDSIVERTACTWGDFDAVVADYLPRDENVHRFDDGRELVTERTNTPAEWATAAAPALGAFADSYTVRNTLRPLADLERDQADARW